MIRNQINSAWQSVFAGSGGIQNVGGTDIHVYEGGAAPDASSPYVVLGPRQYWVNEKPAAVVYVRCTQGKGFVTSYNIGSSSTGVVGTMVTVVEMYTAIADGTGYELGDALRRTETIDSTDGTSAVSWFNSTKQQKVTTQPAANEIAKQQNEALTDAELELRLKQTCIVASDGALLNPDNYPSTLSYNTDGTLAYVQFVANGKTYRQTLGYTDGVLTSVTAWELQ